MELQLFLYLKWAKNELGHINYILEIQEMSEKAQWTNEGDVSKLFGTHLGYMLMSKRWIHFLSRNFLSKLKYWSLIHLQLASRAIIVNSILVSTLWFFINIWGGSKKVIKKCKSFCHNFLWARKEHRARTKVNWSNWCAHKSIEGLRLLPPCWTNGWFLPLNQGQLTLKPCYTSHYRTKSLLNTKDGSPI